MLVIPKGVADTRNGIQMVDLRTNLAKNIYDKNVKWIDIVKNDSTKKVKALKLWL